MADKSVKLPGGQEVAISQSDWDFCVKVVDEINRYRKDAKLADLKVNDQLMACGQLRAKELPAKYDHTRPDGRKWFSIFEDQKVKVLSYGENCLLIGKGHPQDAAYAVQKWWESPAHKANILNNGVDSIGIGYAPDTSTGRYYLDMLIAKF